MCLVRLDATCPRFNFYFGFRGGFMPLTAAETHEVTQLETANRKIYVLDTNVLLHDPTAVTAFAEHHVVIPMTVLEELD